MRQHGNDSFRATWVLTTVMTVAACAAPRGDEEALEWSGMTETEGKTDRIAAPFSDIEGHPLAEYIDTMRAAGYLVGYPDGSFRPNRDITRAELAAAFDKLLRLPDLARERGDDRWRTLSFTDLEPDHWASSVVRRAVQQGLLRAPDGEFRPDDPVTRGQITAALAVWMNENWETSPDPHLSPGDGAFLRDNFGESLDLRAIPEGHGGDAEGILAAAATAQTIVAWDDDPTSVDPVAALAHDANRAWVAATLYQVAYRLDRFCDRFEEGPGGCIPRLDDELHPSSGFRPSQSAVETDVDIEVSEPCRAEFESRFADYVVVAMRMPSAEGGNALHLVTTAPGDRLIARADGPELEDGMTLVGDHLEAVFTRDGDVLPFALHDGRCRLQAASSPEEHAAYEELLPHVRSMFQTHPRPQTD